MRSVVVPLNWIWTSHRQSLNRDARPRRAACGTVLSVDEVYALFHRCRHGVPGVFGSRSAAAWLCGDAALGTFTRGPEWELSEKHVRHSG